MTKMCQARNEAGELVCSKEAASNRTVCHAHQSQRKRTGNDHYEPLASETRAQTQSDQMTELDLKTNLLKHRTKNINDLRRMKNTAERLGDTDDLIETVGMVFGTNATVSSEDVIDLEAEVVASVESTHLQDSVERLTKETQQKDSEIEALKAELLKRDQVIEATQQQLSEAEAECESKNSELASLNNIVQQRTRERDTALIEKQRARDAQTTNYQRHPAGRSFPTASTKLQSKGRAKRTVAPQPEETHDITEFINDDQ